MFANANLADSRYLLTPPAQMGQFAEEAGFDGVEWHPLFYPAHLVTRAVRRGDLKINSLHQSFRINAQDGDTDNYESEPTLQAKVVAGPLGRLVMPGVLQSAAFMATVQAETGPLPAVLYPQSDTEQDRQALQKAQAAYNIFQPTDHVARLLGAQTAEDLLTESAARGYSGLCIDTFHTQRRYQREQPGPISDLDAALPILAPHTQALHVSLNRRDIASESHIPTEQDLHDALQGRFRGATREILDAVSELGSAQFVVLELTAGSLAEVTGHTKRDDIQKDYRQLRDSLADYFDSVPSTVS